MEKLSGLPNIGEDTEKQLNEVGIYTKDDLENIGATEAWLKLQEIDPSACIHRLMGLEGAIQGIKKTDLSLETKAYLKDFYHKHKL